MHPPIIFQSHGGCRGTAPSLLPTGRCRDGQDSRGRRPAWSLSREHHASCNDQPARAGFRHRRIPDPARLRSVCPATARSPERKALPRAKSVHRPATRLPELRCGDGRRSCGMRGSLAREVLGREPAVQDRPGSTQGVFPKVSRTVKPAKCCLDKVIVVAAHRFFFEQVYFLPRKTRAAGRTAAPTHDCERIAVLADQLDRYLGVADRHLFSFSGFGRGLPRHLIGRWLRPSRTEIGLLHDLVSASEFPLPDHWWTQDASWRQSILVGLSIFTTPSRAVFALET